MGLCPQGKCDERDVRHGVRVRRWDCRQAPRPCCRTDRAWQPAALRRDAETAHREAQRRPTGRESSASKHNKSCNKEREAGCEKKHKDCNKKRRATCDESEKALGKRLEWLACPVQQAGLGARA